MTDAEVKEYIRAHNLDIRTPEQVASFLRDRVHCPGSAWDKKEIARHVHKENFASVWAKTMEILKETNHDRNENHK